MKKNRRALIIIIVALATLGLYLVINYKEIRQNFINGLNDGKAEKANENK